MSSKAMDRCFRLWSNAGGLLGTLWVLERQPGNYVAAIFGYLAGGVIGCVVAAVICRLRGARW